MNVGGGCNSEQGVWRVKQGNWAQDGDRFGLDPGSDPGEPNRFGWYKKGVTLISFISLISFSLYHSIALFSLYLTSSSPAVLRHPPQRLADQGGGATAQERKKIPFL